MYCINNNNISVIVIPILQVRKLGSEKLSNLLNKLSGRARLKAMSVLLQCHVYP